MCRSIKQLRQLDRSPTEEEIQAAALQFVDEDIRDDPNLYPTADVMQRLHTYAPCSNGYIRQIYRAWTEIVTRQ